MDKLSVIVPLILVFLLLTNGQEEEQNTNDERPTEDTHIAAPDSLAEDFGNDDGSESGISTPIDADSGDLEGSPPGTEAALGGIIGENPEARDDFKHPPPDQHDEDTAATHGHNHDPTPTHDPTNDLTHEAALASASHETFGIHLGGIDEKKVAEAVAWLETIVSCVKKTQNAVDKLTGLSGVGDTSALISEILTVTSQTLAIVAQGVGLAAAIINFVLSFFLPTEQDLVRQDLSAISVQISQLNHQLKAATTEIKSSVEFNNWLTTYVTWEFTIRNGETKLNELMMTMAELDDPQEKMSLAMAYVAYFESSDIEGALLNVHRLAGEPSSVTSTNLFELFVAEVGHHPNDLSNLMLVLSDIVLSGASQLMTYKALKEGVHQAGDAYLRTHRMLDDIRYQYEMNVWYIMRDVRIHAIENTKSILNTHQYLNDEYGVADDIQKELSSHFGWYQWAVVITGENGVHTSGKYESRGTDYFYLNQYGPEKINAVILWQDMTRQATGCTDSMDGATLLFLADSAGSSPYDIISSDGIMTTEKCWASRQQVQDYYLGEQLAYEMPQWLSSVQYETNTDCDDPKSCSDHGQCRVVPSSAATICLCDKGYHGDKCESHTNIDAERMLLAQLALLRVSYGHFTELPSANIHTTIKQLDDNMDDGRERIMDILDYLKSLINNGDVLNKAQYISGRYTELLKGNLTEDQFGQLMTDFLRLESTDYILEMLQKILLGISVFDGPNTDILTAYKKAYIAKRGAGVACTKEYAEHVSHMLQKLSGLDETVSESMIRYQKWKLENSSSTDQAVIMDGMEAYLSEWQTRHNTYVTTWTSQSCPKLRTKDLVQNHCGALASFEGLTLELECENNKDPYPAEVTCQKVGDTLEWSDSPICDYTWSPWSQWSQCTEQCGGGIQNRTRSKLNNDEDEVERSCNTHTCCQAMYGRRLCGSGECIDLTQDCDGTIDCVDGSDEASCSYVTSGNKISLESSCGAYLNCKCTRTSCGWWFTKEASCRSDSEEENGSDVEFTIYNDRGVDTAIQHGDTIALQFRTQGAKGYWLSCPGDGSSCSVSGCLGAIVSQDKWASCAKETFTLVSPLRAAACATLDGSCLGQPILPRDIVYLRSQTRWLSGPEDDVINTSTCLGDHVGSGDNKCSCERWTLFKT